MPFHSLGPSQWPAQPGRVPSLDGLRGVSVLIVLIGHFIMPASLIGISALGLKLFFFLSGFLITRLLLAEAATRSGSIDLVAFYARRLLRLYPVLLAYMAATFATAVARGVRVDGTDAASVFFYFVNYQVIAHQHAGTRFTLPVEMLWSLSIEEHFYLAAPIALASLRARAGSALRLALVVCVMCLLLRLAYAHADPSLVDTLEIYWRSETRFDCIAFGVALACLPELSPGRRAIGWLSGRPAFAAGVALLLASFAIRNHHFQNTWRFTLQGMALLPIFCGVVFAAPFPRINALLNGRFLPTMGAWSYSLYVWHGSIDFFFRAPIEKLPHAWQPATHLMLSFALGYASFRLVERPAQRLRGRMALWPRNARPAPADATVT